MTNWKVTDLLSYSRPTKFFSCVIFQSAVFQSPKFSYIGLRPSFCSSSESSRSVFPVRHFQRLLSVHLTTNNALQLTEKLRVHEVQDQATVILQTLMLKTLIVEIEAVTKTLTHGTSKKAATINGRRFQYQQVTNLLAFYRATLYQRGYQLWPCLSVRLSVRRRYCTETTRQLELVYGNGMEASFLLHGVILLK